MQRSLRWAILGTMLLGTMLAVLDSSILNISTVSMLQEFRVGLSTVEWMLTSYNLAFAAFMIGLGGLGDAVGRRRLYVLGQIVFTIGSGLAAVTAAPWQVITARALQGLGAAALAPNALALILEHFPEDERGSALGIWGAAAGLGGALGPTVGGVVAQAWGWRVLFLANLPLGALVTAAAYALLPPDRGGRGQGFDLRGFFALSAFLLVVSASLLGTPGLNNRSATIGLIGLALLLGIWFAAAERRAAAPLVDLSAIVRPGVLTANVGTFFASFIMAGGMFLSVLYGQLLAGTSAAAIGVLLAPCAVATLAVAPAAGRLSDSLGPRNLAVAGLAGLAVSVALPVLWHPSSAAALVSSSNLIAGISLGIAAPALLRASVEPVPRKHAGVGAGLYKTVNELCGVFGVVLLGTLLEARVVANALRQIPDRFFPQPLTLRALTPPGAVETYALQHGLAPQAAGDFQRT